MSVQFSIRVEDELHAKLRVLAAFKDESLNAVVNEGLRLVVDRWEQQHGTLPLPPGMTPTEQN